LIAQTTTTDTQVVYPAHRYRDAAAAIDWLEKAFGFDRKEVHEATTGRSSTPSSRSLPES
jgi:uncharacterized glyoxalase superfamily protein PhnB